jgi:L-asparaginase II
MEIGAGRLYAKGGAEGVYCGAVPELGLGIALKIDDGSERGAESAMCAVLSSIFGNDEDLSAKLGSKAIRVISNRKGSAVGETRPAEILQLSA